MSKYVRNAEQEATGNDCCNVGKQLRGAYDYVLKEEAIAYARVIAHRAGHERVRFTVRGVQHMRMVREIADQYAEGNAEALD